MPDFRIEPSDDLAIVQLLSLSAEEAVAEADTPPLAWLSHTRLVVAQDDVQRLRDAFTGAGLVEERIAA